MTTKRGNQITPNNMNTPHKYNHIYSYKFRAHFAEKTLTFRVSERTDAKAFEVAAESINAEADDIPMLELVSSKINSGTKIMLGMELGIKVTKKKAA